MTDLPQSSQLPLGDACAPPRGWSAMIAQNPAYARRWAAQVVLTPEAWNALGEARDKLAWHFVPEPAAKDEWVVDPFALSGDCEDWCLACRRAMVMAGFPRDALRIALCRLPDGRDHAVLAIATDRGDFIADVLTPGLRPWAECGYQWIAVEGPAGVWRAIQPAVALADLARA